MQNINYYISLILSSRYLPIINSFLGLIILLIMREGHYAFCMNETNIPDIAEPKVPIVRGLQVLTPLQMEISKFLDDAKIIEDQNKVIVSQEASIQRLQHENELRKRAIQSYRDSYGTIIRRLDSYKTKYLNLFSENQSKVIRLHGIDGVTQKRYVLTPEDHDRLISRLNTYSTYSLLLSVGVILIGGYYMWDHFNDPTGIKAWQRELFRKIDKL